MRKIYIIGAMACMFAACKPNVTVTKKLTQGEADFTNYLAIGNSLTAGYADGSLTVSGQLNSYPQRLFEQFQLVTNVKGTFVQPLVTGDNGYPRPKKILAYIYGTCVRDTSLGAIDYPGSLDSIGSSRFVSTVNNGQINNIGVPGIRAVDYQVANYALIAAQGGSPYAMRFYNNVTSSPLDELKYRVNNLHPTFFTMWLGSNDVLGFATSGGEGDGSGYAVPLAAPYFYNPNDISPFAQFDSSYDKAVNVAKSTGASGALINIPDVASLPFFTTIPINGLSIKTQAFADSLQKRWGSVTHKVFEIGANNFIVEDHNGNVRQSIPGELLLLTLPMDSIKCGGWGITKAIPKQYVITTEELQNIRTATEHYNSFIQFTAKRNNLAYVDMHTFMGRIATGYAYNGIKYTTDYITGGAFSLDGIHPNHRGYALLANEIIKSINDFYKSTMPLLDVNKYHGIDFP